MKRLLSWLRPKPKITVTTYQTGRQAQNRDRIRRVCDRMRKEAGLKPVDWGKL